MFIKTLLVTVLIFANLVGTSAMTSASAQTPRELAALTKGEQRALIETLIKTHFPAHAAPRMIAIADCESTGVLHVTSRGELVSNPSRAFVGVLQVAHHVHRREIARLRLEENRDVLGDISEYIRFTRHLYDQARHTSRSGFSPWPSCGLRAQARLAPQDEQLYFPVQSNRRNARARGRTQVATVL